MYVVCTELATTLCCRGGEGMNIKKELEMLRAELERRDEKFRAEFETEKLNNVIMRQKVAEFEADNVNMRQKVAEVEARVEEVAEAVSGCWCK